MNKKQKELVDLLLENQEYKIEILYYSDMEKSTKKRIISNHYSIQHDNFYIDIMTKYEIFSLSLNHPIQIVIREHKFVKSISITYDNNDDDILIFINQI